MAADIIVTLSDPDKAELAAAFQTIRAKFPQAQAVSGAEAKKLLKLREKAWASSAWPGPGPRSSDAMPDHAKPAAHDAIKGSYNTVAE